MGDVLLALCIPLTVCASGIYAVCESWWRRRRPYPYPYTHAGARLAEQEMLLAAEEIVEEAYARLADLYDDSYADAYDNECTGAYGGAYGGVSAGSTPDHGPSSPAAARTGTRPPAH